MRLCTYTVTHDHGLAPNPFWGYCTVAVCAPNYLGIRLAPGDWLVGLTPRVRGNRLLYAMELSEVLHFDDYFHDQRFQEKKPVMNGSWQRLRGDNIYYRDECGEWQRLPSHFHQKEKKIRQDLRNPFAFIAEHFYYFGENAIELLPPFADLVVGRGIKCKHDPDLVGNFLTWLQANHEPGIHGEPYDRPRPQRSLTSTT